MAFHDLWAQTCVNVIEAHYNDSIESMADAALKSQSVRSTWSLKSADEAALALYFAFIEMPLYRFDVARDISSRFPEFKGACDMICSSESDEINQDESIRAECGYIGREMGSYSDELIRDTSFKVLLMGYLVQTGSTAESVMPILSSLGVDCPPPAGVVPEVINIVACIMWLFDYPGFRTKVDELRSSRSRKKEKNAGTAPAEPGDKSAGKSSHAGVGPAIAICAGMAIIVIFLVVLLLRPAGDVQQEQPATSSSTTASSTTSVLAGGSAKDSDNVADSNATVVKVRTAKGKLLKGKVHRDKSGNVIADSSSREYSESEIKSMKLTDAELCIAWNEPFARQGYHFKNPGLRKYFNSCSWYTDTHNSASLTGVAARNNTTLRNIAASDSSAKRWMNLATS